MYPCSVGSILCCQSKPVTGRGRLRCRDKDGLSRFLRVEVVLQGATYYVVFMDADAMPPPFRVDNFSEVNITYYQVNSVTCPEIDDG